jgi:hypothetical protein
MLAHPPGAGAQVRFQFVYAQDRTTADFFQPEIKKALQQAADTLTSRLYDRLEKRTITNPNVPGWVVFDPSNPANPTPPTLASFFGNATKVEVPADTVLVLVGAHAYASDRLNHGGSSYSFSDPRAPTQATVDKRGTKHGAPFIGVVSFANDPAYLGPSPSRDFMMNAQHELLHVLGLFNKQVDWDTKSFSMRGQQYYFVGANALAAYKELGGVLDAARPGVPLDVKLPGHWAPSPGDSESPEQKNVGLLQGKDATPIRAALQENNQVRLTPLEYAALKDIGWDVRP